ncbi:unnamed protein product [Notodromas monacha]|uniref:C2H2-type domain-containing protein n=1 Tax=Notodromas monacha TaxID=399045 RepID=A0A7R9GCY2_9CRUS|nr:unnamed protein product [Notodromas monacha]CAG0916338.1 unnamed protein product [Notodromas monacha]
MEGGGSSISEPLDTKPALPVSPPAPPSRAPSVPPPSQVPPPPPPSSTRSESPLSDSNNIDAGEDCPHPLSQRPSPHPPPAIAPGHPAAAATQPPPQQQPPPPPSLHPFLQSLIQHQHLQSLPPPQQQQWLQAALSSQLFLPQLPHPFLKLRPPSLVAQAQGAAQLPPPPQLTASHPQLPPSSSSSSSSASRPGTSAARLAAAAMDASCVVCRRVLDTSGSDCLVLAALTLTASSGTFSEKLEDIVGVRLSALGRAADLICKRCMGLVSLVDRMELELSAAKEQVVVEERDLKPFDEIDEADMDELDDPHGEEIMDLSRQQQVAPICCEFCEASFSKAHRYEYHVNKTHLKQAPYGCKVCGRGFFSDLALVAHMAKRRHFACAAEQLLRLDDAATAVFDPGSQLTRWRCPSCDVSLRSKPALRLHVASTHVPPRGKYQCRHCGLGFMQLAALETHVNREHLKHPPIPCDDCDRVFFSEAALAGHKAASRRRFECHVCKQDCGSPQALQVHAQAVHGGAGQVLACPLCFMLFPSEGSLMQHQRTGCAGLAAAAMTITFPPPPPDGHGGGGGGGGGGSLGGGGGGGGAGMLMSPMKSFLCRSCGETYRTKDALDRHLWLVHSIKAENVIIYRCDECGKEYTKKQRYDTHMMLHRGERPHRCPYCKYDTNIRGNLRLHVKNVHKVELPLMRRKRGQD